MRGVSLEDLGRFITEKGNHRWSWRGMVPVFTLQEDCPGQGGLVCCA